MDDNILHKKLNYKPEGRRNIRRPLMRWEDDFRKEEQARGLSVIVDDICFMDCVETVI